MMRRKRSAFTVEDFLYLGREPIQRNIRRAPLLDPGATGSNDMAPIAWANVSQPLQRPDACRVAGRGV
ncbi:hypothetical protein LL999_20655 [Burkholderia ambifaria]|uniref:hypothetical protein n=1 Tax=Burkholderia ambifaria TaxID=152480 RepID=UPI001E42888A|nr:hypothetical protein [Burkholderia ambifaria]UEP25028.1 hypothetical protein LL999_20655 [Burkholderia ambifaria]